MKRLAWIVLGLLGLASPALADYDGPTPVLQKNYSENGISIDNFAIQAKVLNGGRARFTATIHVPIVAANVGRNTVLEIWRFLGSGDVRIDDGCAHLALAGEVGTTVTFTCEVFQLIPGGGLTNGSFVTIYPKVIRNSTGGTLELNGLSNPIDVPVVGEDANEPNNTLLSATTLTVASGVPTTRIDLVLGLNNDYFRFTAPAGTASADILIQFWNSANDIDLLLFDDSGVELTRSANSFDEERILFSVSAGQTYYIGVEPSFDTNPAFYDLSVTLGSAHTVTAAPTATPSTVVSGGITTLTANGGDTLAHPLTYSWQHVLAQCPSGSGTFSSLTTANPTWTAPANPSGVAKTCQLRVTVDDGLGTTAQQVVTVTVATLVHGLTITSAATGAPNPVPASGTVALSVTANDTLGHAISYAWTASCPTLASNGTFSPGANAQNPTWTAPANGTASAQPCTMSVIADDGNGLTASSNYTQNVASPASLTNTYYFAEGATINGFFETRLALLNSENTAATVSVEFQLKDTTTVLTYSLNVGGHSRATINVSTLGTIDPTLAALASAEFSTVIRSDRPLVADRTMTWDSRGYGSHAETAITAPASTWYLAEGATIGDFELYYLIQNPNPTPLDFTVTYLLPPPTAPIVRTYPIGANTRTNIAVHAEPGLENVEVSAVITSPVGKPIIVERAMYLTTGSLFYGAGHESAGIKAPATQWFFAEGATGDFFDLFILIANPGTTAATITATFLFDDGATCTTGATVDPKSRYNIWVDTLVLAGCPRDISNAAVSTTITSDVPVIAERSMWWPGPTAATWAEAHNAAGATGTGTKWGLADGEQGGARANETYILIANASSFAGTARVTLYLEDGSTLQKDVTLAANSRTNVAVGAPTNAGGFGAAVAGKRFGAVILSLPVENQPGAAQIVVERAMYSNGPGAPFWAAGTDVLATKLQ